MKGNAFCLSAVQNKHILFQSKQVEEAFYESLDLRVS